MHAHPSVSNDAQLEISNMSMPQKTYFKRIPNFCMTCGDCSMPSAHLQATSTAKAACSEHLLRWLPFATTLAADMS